MPESNRHAWRRGPEFNRQGMPQNVSAPKWYCKTVVNLWATGVGLIPAEFHICI